MTRRTRRSIRALAIATALLLAAPLAAGASGAAPTGAPVPHGAVVLIGDTAIARATFKRWFAIAVRSNPGGARSIRGYDPPSFAPCIVRLRKREREHRPPGTPRRSTARLRAVCKAEYEGLRDQVLEFLILEQWVAGEVRDLGIEPTAKQLEDEFRTARETSFPSDADFRRFLRTSGMTMADARLQTAFNTRYVALRDRAIASAAPVTDAQVRAVYDADPQRFARPETRDVRFVFTRSRSDARAARAALAGGQTWRRVARRYSIDRATRDRGGLERGVELDVRESPITRSMFRAPKGRLRGPVRAQTGYYVFEVVAITRARPRTFEEVEREIRSQLDLQRATEAGERFDDGLVAKWRPRTTCRTGFVVSQCANGLDRERDLVQRQVGRRALVGARADLAGSVEPSR